MLDHRRHRDRNTWRLVVTPFGLELVWSLRSLPSLSPSQLRYGAALKNTHTRHITPWLQVQREHIVVISKHLLLKQPPWSLLDIIWSNSYPNAPWSRYWLPRMSRKQVARSFQAPLSLIKHKSGKKTDRMSKHSGTPRNDRRERFGFIRHALTWITI